MQCVVHVPTELPLTPLVVGAHTFSHDGDAAPERAEPPHQVVVAQLAVRVERNSQGDCVEKKGGLPNQHHWCQFIDA